MGAFLDLIGVTADRRFRFFGFLALALPIFFGGAIGFALFVIAVGQPVGLAASHIHDTLWWVNIFHI